MISVTVTFSTTKPLTQDEAQHFWTDGVNLKTLAASTYTWTTGYLDTDSFLDAVKFVTDDARFSSQHDVTILQVAAVTREFEESK